MQKSQKSVETAIFVKFMEGVKMSGIFTSCDLSQIFWWLKLFMCELNVDNISDLQLQCCDVVILSTGRKYTQSSLRRLYWRLEPPFYPGKP